MRVSTMRRSTLAILTAIALVGGFTACGGGGGGGGDGGGGGGGGTLPPAQPLPTPPSIVIGEYDRLPGCNVVITGVVGATGANGAVVAGDVLGVKFTVKANDGTDLYVPTMTNGQIYLSGPTSNYNRVIVPQTNVVANAIYLGGGEWGYYLPAMPSVYAAPLNDTPSFGAIDGELTGQALLDGTYTIGLQLVANYEFDNESFRDGGSATYNLLYGGATTITPRAVVADANCNVCHTTVRAHGGTRVDVDLCLLCHTAGAEDRNTPSAAGGTPDVSVDFKVMIHKIHNGKHLPSVNGVTTDVNGARVYGTGVPMQYVGFNNSIVDVSGVGFPVFPAFNIQMPRDSGYAALSSTNQGKENLIRTGIVSCDKCHGDPDGSGTETAPAQGDLWKTQPSRKACGSCHDDVDWAKPYTSNLQTMGANKGNETCALSGCHDVSGTPLSVFDAHRHPILNPAQAPEIAVNVSEVKEAGVNNSDGTVDPGEKIQVKFRIQYTNGANAGLDVPLTAFHTPVSPATAGSFTMIISGPTSNYNLVVNSGVPMSATAASAHPAWANPVGGVYTMLVPEQILLEKVGVGAAGLDNFVTARGALATNLTTLYKRGVAGGTPGSTTATVAAQKRQNYFDVASIANFANPDYVVIDDGLATEEYAQVAVGEGNRLWIKQQLRFAHAAGATIQEITLTTVTASGNWAVSGGNIAELSDQFTAGQVAVATYWADFVMPTEFPAPINDTPDLGESFGEWKNKAIVDGTYTLDCYARVNNGVVLYGESQSYPSTSDAGAADFLVGSATTIEPYTVISNDSNCYTCHNDIWFHGGGRRGFNTCIMCHGDSTAEDAGRFKTNTANYVDTVGVSIGFREMLHKIHKGEELANAATYEVLGNGTPPSRNGYGEVVFPAWPGGVRQCERCHGNDAWHAPQNRTHPAVGSVPARVWGFVCGSCHDSTSAHAHIDTQTAPNGQEACDVCHGEGKPEDVVKVHVPR